MVWVWLGSTEAPSFPHLPFTILQPDQVLVTVTKVSCNWLQGVEASLDSAHVGTPHSTYMGRPQSDGGPESANHTLDVLAPRYEVERTAYGLDAAAIRPLVDGSAYLRTTKWNLIQEDMVTQASMGPTVDRTQEHLSSSDVAIIQARRLLLQALADVGRGTNATRR